GGESAGVGGAGGGSVAIYALDAVIDGRIEADGADASAGVDAGGGGAGGGILIAASRLTCNGVLSVRGGDGALSTDATDVGGGGGTVDQGGGRGRWWADADGDGHGDPYTGITTGDCVPPSGYVGIADDCDDTDSLVSPDTLEGCNNIDDDCDGMVDEGCLTGA